MELRVPSKGFPRKRGSSGIFGFLEIDRSGFSQESDVESKRRFPLKKTVGKSVVDASKSERVPNPPSLFESRRHREGSGL